MIILGLHCILECTSECQLCTLIIRNQLEVVVAMEADMPGDKRTGASPGFGYVSFGNGFKGSPSLPHSLHVTTYKCLLLCVCVRVCMHRLNVHVL